MMADGQACPSKPIRTCCATRAALPWALKAQTPGLTKTTWDTGIFNTPSNIRRPIPHGLNGCVGEVQEKAYPMEPIRRRRVDPEVEHRRCVIVPLLRTHRDGLRAREIGEAPGISKNLT